MRFTLAIVLTLSSGLTASTIFAADAESPPAADEFYVAAEPALDLTGWDDPAYSRMVDFALLGEALADGDASAVTDVALQMAHAEKVLLRKHPKLTSADVLDAAVNVARNSGDKDALARIADVARAHGLNDVSKKVQVAMALGGASRAIEPPPGLSIDTDPATLAEFQMLAAQVEAAENAGDKEILSGLLADVVLSDLPDAHSKWLEKRIGLAIESSEEGGEPAEALGLLVASSRGGIFGGGYDPFNRNNVSGVKIDTFKGMRITENVTGQALRYERDRHAAIAKKALPYPFAPREPKTFENYGQSSPNGYERAPGGRINNNGSVYTNDGRYLGKATVGTNPQTGRKALVYTSPNGKRLVRRFNEGGNGLENQTYRRRQ